MDFGIAFPTYVDAWRDAERAEAAGFTHAWFYDSQLLYADVYSAMALAATHTRRMRLGTLVAIPSNRIAPVTASAAATINALAPGRVILGIGTGFTGRNTMGLPPVPVADMATYVEQVRGLLAGEDVLLREGQTERWIRLLHRDRALGFLNTDDPIPIHVAANAARALAAVGRVGDGWITVGQGPEGVTAGLTAIGAEADRASRTFQGSWAPSKPYTTMLTAACILRDGETPMSPRVRDRVGPVAILPMHAAWETAHGGAGFGVTDDAAARAYGDYIDRHAAARGSTPDRRYLDVHEGHMVFLKPGEEVFLDEGLISLTLTGPADEIRQRIQRLAEAGVDQLAIQALPGQGADLIDEFSRHVLGRV